MDLIRGALLGQLPLLDMPARCRHLLDTPEGSALPTSMMKGATAHGKAAAGTGGGRRSRGGRSVVREVCYPCGASSAHLNAGMWEGEYGCRLLPLVMPALRLTVRLLLVVWGGGMVDREG